jgi:hypothetical protein
MDSHQHHGVYRFVGAGDDAPHVQDFSDVAEKALYPQSATTEAQKIAAH